MKPSLAFMGVLVVAFATSALLTAAIETLDGTTVSHPKLFSPLTWSDDLAGPDVAHARDLAPDSLALRSVSGALVPNLGQVAHDVYFQFVSRTLVANFQAHSIDFLPGSDAGRTRADRVTCRFVGANGRPEVEATQSVSKRLKYTIANTDDYTASVPLFSELRYKDLYDGVDLQIMVTESGLTRRFVIEAGVPTSTLLMHFEGAATPFVTSSRALEIPAGSQKFTLSPPVAYQFVNGKRTAVSASFDIGRFGAVGFAVGPMDPSLPLVIEV